MKEMCLPCYGTGQIRCLVCGGVGSRRNISVLGKDCLKCTGTGQQHCQLCRGSGFVGGEVVGEQPDERPVEWNLPIAARHSKQV